MLRVGLTGGIGSGKSTVSTEMAHLGARVIDADQIAREVVAPGTPALAAITARFGAELVSADGVLDRAALGRIVFGDAAALRALEAITHPAIWARTAERFAELPEGAIAVHDMPLLVEAEMTGEYHVVIVVGAAEQVRLERLVHLRGMDESDARARIAAQATDEHRRAAADVWLPNEGTPEQLAAAVHDLWRERLIPYSHNLVHGLRSHRSVSEQSPPDPTWPAQAERLMARIRHAVGARALAVEHVGSTAVPGLAAKDVIDLQVGVQSLAEADDPTFVERLAAAGFPRVEGVDHDNGKDGRPWPKRLHGSSDPGRVAHVHVRELGSPGWTWALALRDRLRSDPGERAAYARAKAALAARHPEATEYAEAKEAWFDAAHARWEVAARATRDPLTG